jgi:hypothetical protein
MWLWILTAGVWALFVVSLAWLLHHREEPAGSRFGASAKSGARPAVGDNEPEGRRWRQRSWWSKTR